MDLDPSPPNTLETIYAASPTPLQITITDPFQIQIFRDAASEINRNVGSTGKGILIGMLSAFGSALLVAIILAIVYFFRYTTRGRIILDRIGRPGEYDDEQAFAKEEAEALEEMDDIQRTEYMRAKAFAQVNPPESAQTDISLSQFLAIQEKGVSAWEFEPELEIANCFVEGRTEIEFFDSECSVQSNLPVPKQNEVYYWEAKIYDKPDTTIIGIGFTTKPYPLFRMPGYHKTSIAYTSAGHRRFNQPFVPTPYAPPYVQGDVIGIGYRPRTGTVFFTRNGKKLDDITHALKTQNLFPTVGATGPATVHVNFGQMGFVFIEANVKKWGLAPMTGSLAPPPPYGSEQGSILLEGGQFGVVEGQGWTQASGWTGGHPRTKSAQFRLGRQPPSSGPQRSSTDISLAQLSLNDTGDVQDDAGEGTSGSTRDMDVVADAGPGNEGMGLVDFAGDDMVPPPEYESPSDDYEGRESRERRLESEDQDDDDDDDDDCSTPRPSTAVRDEEEERVHLLDRTKDSAGDASPPIPSYDVAVSNRQGRIG